VRLTVLTRAASADVLRLPPVASWVRVESEIGNTPERIPSDSGELYLTLHLPPVLGEE
jgi:hypothetical protein